MYEVEVVAQEEYFAEGTVLEGELVWRHPDEAAMLYLVFDAVLVRGERVTHLPFAERLAKAVQCVRWSEELAALPPDDLEARVAETDSLALVQFDPPIAMRAKHFVAQEHAARVWRDPRGGGPPRRRADPALRRRAVQVRHGHRRGVQVEGVPHRGPARPAAAAGRGRARGRGAPRGGAWRCCPAAWRCRTARSPSTTWTWTRRRCACSRCARGRTSAPPNGRRVVEATVRDALEALTPDDL